MDYYKLKVLNNRKKFIMLFCFTFLIGILVYYFFVYKNKNDDNIVKDDSIVINEETNNINNMDIIIVDIKGKVANPGVYSFKQSDNARINDLIIKAGGLIKDADTSMINLSKKLEDEMIIIVYSKNEVSNYTKTQDDLKKKLEICENKLKNDGCIKENVIESKGKVNINEATSEELQTLSGIGKSKASAIIEYRKKNKFNSINDIMKVDGIGESLFASIKGDITV